jgi:hypothetical protein
MDTCKAQSFDEWLDMLPINADSVEKETRSLLNLQQFVFVRQRRYGLGGTEEWEVFLETWKKCFQFLPNVLQAVADFFGCAILLLVPRPEAKGHDVAARALVLLPKSCTFDATPLVAVFTGFALWSVELPCLEESFHSTLPADFRTDAQPRLLNPVRLPLAAFGVPPAPGPSTMQSPPCSTTSLERCFGPQQTRKDVQLASP